MFGQAVKEKTVFKNDDDIHVHVHLGIKIISIDLNVFSCLQENLQCYCWQTFLCFGVI